MKSRAARLTSLLLLLSGALTCAPSSGQRARSRVIESRKDLIGGPHTLGDVGDYLLENGEARFVIQKPGYSRGFGVFGGGLIDADLQRPVAMGDENGQRGHDNFAEMFPALFLLAMEPEDVTINGEDLPAMEARPGPSGSAEVVVRGRSNDFLALTDTLNNALVVDSGQDVGAFFFFETTYRLPPTGRTVEISTRIINPADAPAPIQLIGKSPPGFGDIKLDIPLGDVVLFGAGNKVFAPGDGGFDLRYRLEQHYAENTQLPALPGIIVDYLASVNEWVSYGVFAPLAQRESPTAPHPNFVMDKADKYPGRARNGALLVPFTASSFTGVFHSQGPKKLRAGEEFTATRYFTVGNGDVASVAEEVFRLRATPHGTLAGRVLDTVTRAPVKGAWVIALDAEGQPICQATTREGGAFSMPLTPGSWRVLVKADGRDISVPQSIDVATGGYTGVDLLAQPTGHLSVVVRDEKGAPLPSKVTLVGSYAADQSGRDPKQFLFNLSIGEEWRNTDMVPDTSNAATRRFVEEVLFTAHGAVSATVRPGTYEVHVSRGIEYDTHVQTVTITPGGSAEVSAVLARTVDTSGYTSADFHVHSVKSIDSSCAEEPRVISYAAEGVDVMVSTDHNYVMDFAPVVARLGLTEWLQSFVGLELTTLEMGHFNGFPLRYEVGPATHGSFEWSSKTPDELFAALRGLGLLGADRTIVQVNHPRDTILGYLNNFGWNQDTGVAEGQNNLLFGVNPEQYPNFAKENFSLDFDAWEVFNGKHFEFVHNYRVPDPLPPPPLPTDITIPPPGSVLRDGSGDIAFPGAVDDWFQLLRLGNLQTGIANSDSHKPVFDEAGYPRSYVRSARDVPARFTADEMVDGIRSHDVLMTNGPFVTVAVEGVGMGGLVPAAAGTVRVSGEVRMASWIHPHEVIVYEGGDVVSRLTIPADTRVFPYQFDVPVTRDTFINVEVDGGDSLFPVVTTADEPSLLINDAIKAIGGSFGLGADPWGNLKPKLTFPVHPYALTNPVFVDVDGNGAYDPPGLRQGGQQGLVTGPRLLVGDVPVSSVGPVQGPIRLWDLINRPVPGQANDIRRVFQAFSRHDF
ncbi:MAG: carboxypeptidase regulatory-like domain-containing protein [Deltaproteobacteria bacterium]|nr:carboxypeptidase regulatory-like domain-containing protein [Deltaproteobacteria bacterium]